MERAADILVGTHDFMAFQSSGSETSGADTHDYAFGLV